MTVKESDMVPQIISCGLEKNGQGYKAFKNIKSEFDIKHFRVAFADKTDHIFSADNKDDARYKAIKWKLNNL